MGFLCKLQQAGNNRGTTELAKPLMFFNSPEFRQGGREFEESPTWKAPLVGSPFPLLKAFCLGKDLYL